jgi:hypothetical protein
MPFHEDGVIQIAGLYRDHLPRPEWNSGGMIDVRAFLPADLMSIAEVWAFTELGSEITVDSFRIEGVSTLDAAGSAVELIERVISGDSRKHVDFGDL